MKKFLVLLLSILIILPSSAEAADLNIKRISGEDRYQTAIQTSKDAFEKSEYAIISHGLAYEETLQGAVLGVQAKAPIFLVPDDKLPPNLEGELQRLGVKKAYILGGTDKVSQGIENEIKNLNIEIKRLGTDNDPMSLAGDIQSERRILLGGEVAGDAHATYNPEKLVDAMVAAPYLGRVTFGDTAPGLFPYWPFPYLIFGGTGTFPNEWLEINPNEVIRYGGANRYATAIEVANAIKRDFGGGKDTVILVDGTNLPDALSSGPVARMYDAPILLTDPKSLSKETENYLLTNPSIKNIVIIGGEKSVGDKVVRDLNNLHFNYKAKEEFANFLRGESTISLDQDYIFSEYSPNEYLPAGSYTLRGLENTLINLFDTSYTKEYAYTKYDSGDKQMLVIKFNNINPSFSNWTFFIAYNGNNLELSSVFKDGYRIRSKVFDNGLYTVGGSGGAGVNGDTFYGINSNGSHVELFDINNYSGSWALDVYHILTGDYKYLDRGKYGFSLSLKTFSQDGKIKIAAYSWSPDPNIRRQEEAYLNLLKSKGAEIISTNEMDRLIEEKTGNLVEVQWTSL